MGPLPALPAAALTPTRPTQHGGRLLAHILWRRLHKGEGLASLDGRW